MSQWSHILTRDELEAHYALTASIDPSFAGEERAFYESRTLPQLQSLAIGAWNCSNATGYQMAKSYATILSASC